MYTKCAQANFDVEFFLGTLRKKREILVSQFTKYLLQSKNICLRHSKVSS